jgi:O-antigen/teichoic acid export membrane protein
MLKFSFSISLAFIILFFVYAKEIAYILFWMKFLTSWVILEYSILFLIFNFLLQINFNILAAIWKVKERLKIILWAIVFNAVLNYILLKTIWVYGAALATWCWWILIYVLSELKLKDFRVKFDYKYIFKNLFFLWIIWLILKLLPLNLLTFDRITSFFLLFWISIIYGIIFIFINFSDYKYIFAEIKKLKRK